MFQGKGEKMRFLDRIKFALRGLANRFTDFASDLKEAVNARRTKPESPSKISTAKHTRRNVISRSQMRRAGVGSKFYAGTIDLWKGIQDPDERNKAIIRGLQEKGFDVTDLQDAYNVVNELSGGVLSEELDRVSISNKLGSDWQKYFKAALDVQISLKQA